MFKKIISSLKLGKSEFRSKHSGREDELDEEENSEPNEGETKADDEASRRKNQLSMLIRVVVVIGLGYLAIDHFFLTEDVQPVFVEVQKKPRKRKVIPGKVIEQSPTSPTESNAVVDEKVESKPAIELNTSATEEVAEKNKTPETPAPVENINIAPKQVEENPPPAPEEKVVEEKVVEEKAIKPSSDVNLKIGEMQATHQDDKGLDKLIDSIDEKNKNEEGNLAKKVTKLEDKISADEAYTAPPAYDQLGRGLVYNCKGKFWSCVDKLSYINCNKNMKWNKGNQKQAECAVVNVYNSDEDCGVVQKYNISSGQATPFCQ
jgi:hypothetical protein